MTPTKANKHDKSASRTAAMLMVCPFRLMLKSFSFRSVHRGNLTAWGSALHQCQYDVCFVLRACHTKFSRFFELRPDVFERVHNAAVDINKTVTRLRSD